MKNLLDQLNAMRPTDEDEAPAPIVDKPVPKKRKPKIHACEYCGKKWHTKKVADMCNNTDDCRARRDDAPKHPKYEPDPLDVQAEDGKLSINVSGVLHSTDKAVLYKTLDGMQFWIPKKKHTFNADSLRVTYPDWFQLKLAKYEPFIPRKRRDFS